MSKNALQEWLGVFLLNIENKKALFDLFSKCLVCKCFPEVIKIPIAFTNEKIDHSKYINIGKAVKYLVNDLALKLPDVYAITGCDTTSFIFSVGKVKVLKKFTKQFQKVNLLNGFGETNSWLQSVSKSINYLLFWPGN